MRVAPYNIYTPQDGGLNFVIRFVDPDAYDLSDKLVSILIANKAGEQLFLLDSTSPEISIDAALGTIIIDLDEDSVGNDAYSLLTSSRYQYGVAIGIPSADVDYRVQGEYRIVPRVGQIGVTAECNELGVSFCDNEVLLGLSGPIVIGNPDTITETSTNTLTNKTIDDSSNTVHADALHYQVWVLDDVAVGDQVRYAGYDPGTNTIRVRLADNSLYPAIGTVSKGSLADGLAMVTAAGIVKSLDTSIYTLDDPDIPILWVNGIGKLTGHRPDTGFEQPAAFILRDHAIHGSLQILAAYPLQDADDVRTDATTLEGVVEDQVRVQAALVEIGKLSVAKHDNGFDRSYPMTLPDVAFDLSRNCTVTVKAGFSYYQFWVESKRFRLTTTASVQVPDTTGLYLFYFDADGDLQWGSAPEVYDIIVYTTIVAIGYWNAEHGGWATEATDELHGTIMSSFDHWKDHILVGALYKEGGGINGISVGSGVYASFSAAVIIDEDIVNNIEAQTATREWYLDGAGWWYFPASLSLAIIGITRPMINKITAGVGAQVEIGNNNFCLVHFFFTNNTPSKVMKVQGQGEYSNIGLARAGAYTEISNITTTGLPDPEYVAAYTIILDDDGELVLTDEGELYVPWLGSKLGSGSSPGITQHIELGGLNIQSTAHESYAIKHSANNVGIPADTTTVTGLIDQCSQTNLQPATGTTITLALSGYPTAGLRAEHFFEIEPEDDTPIVNIPAEWLNQTETDPEFAAGKTCSIGIWTTDAGTTVKYFVVNQP